MELADIVALAQRFWVVWLLVLFVGIVVWVFRPRKKQELERHGYIPLEDDQPRTRARSYRQADDGDDGDGGNGE
ncbi:MAG: CcoQ/FixQ family Cbb3-type cytochrome c oxidase assembly chaperone [Alphaproteobacteria bacterium]|jgi:cytochrome c oxidase cbb3-type subunit 4|nr:CcoQ/FixQ family Cbb3-type cytochrome c oxidase assembly chaperone [Alphaproteobacteria bacterium]